MPPLVIVAAVAVAAGAAIAIRGQEQQKKAVKATAEFNSKVQENEAIRVEQENTENARRNRVQNRRLLGKQRAAVAKSGVTTAGSPLELMAETAGELELGILDANRVAQAKQTQARAKASLIRFEGANKASALTTQQVGTGVAAVGKIASMGAGAK